MQKKNNKEKDTKNLQFPGYPHYSWREDIYMNEKEEEDIDPENTKNKKPVNDTSDFLNEKDFSNDLTGDDLDVPGAELDDVMEEVGSEDEENNYFSLGGDNHENLEEDPGDERR